MNLGAPEYCDMEPGEAVLARERSKTTKYFDHARDRNCSFVPFVIDSNGCVGPKGMDLIREIRDEALTHLGLPSSTRLSRGAFLALVSRSWQIDNAAIFSQWSMRSRDAAIRPFL